MCTHFKVQQRYRIRPPHQSPMTGFNNQHTQYIACNLTKRSTWPTCCVRSCLFATATLHVYISISVVVHALPCLRFVSTPSRFSSQSSTPGAFAPIACGHEKPDGANSQSMLHFLSPVPNMSSYSCTHPWQIIHHCDCSTGFRPASHTGLPWPIKSLLCARPSFSPCLQIEGAMGSQE